MRATRWQAIEDEPHNRSTGRGVAVGLVVLVVLLAVVGRAILLGLVYPAAPASETPQATPSIGDQIAPEALASAQWPSPVATRTPIPTPTPPVMRLAVDARVYDQYGRYLSSLAERFPGLSVVVYARETDRDDQLAGETSDALLYWLAEQPNQRAVLIREEPYVLAAHYGTQRQAWTTAQLAAIASGQDQSVTLVTSDEGQSLRELLGVGALAPNVVVEESWSDAKEVIATNADHLGLIPWDATDFRVRVLPVNGSKFDPTNPEDYHLARRMWLDAQHGAPVALLEDLHFALRYDAGLCFTLAAVGDLMLASYMDDPAGAHSPEYPFEDEGVQEALAGADIAVGNLECAISTGGRQQDKTYTFRAAPEVVDGLLYAGLDVLSLANNHAGDYGDEALVDTLDLLAARGIVAVGAGRNSAEARQARTVVVNGLRVAFLAYNQILPASFEAGVDSPGVAWMRESEMVADVTAARAAADLVVVICHWGDEYSSYANASQRTVARALADAGADLVLGHHPHVLQGLGFFDDTLVAYSLGNFVFYPMSTAGTSESVILRCVLDSTGVKMVDWLPAVIDASQPQLASVEVTQTINARILRLTQEQSALPKPIS